MHIKCQKPHDFDHIVCTSFEQSQICSVAPWSFALHSFILPPIDRWNVFASHLAIHSHSTQRLTLKDRFCQQENNNLNNDSHSLEIQCHYLHHITS